MKPAKYRQRLIIDNQENEDVPATNMASSQLGFISKWMAPCGKTVAVPGRMSISAKRAPFSTNTPPRSVVLIEKLISVARG